MSPPTEQHCFYCFDALHAHLHNDTGPIIEPTFPNDMFPLFVSWHSHPPHATSPRLRGCIGQFSPQPLHQALKDYAIISATQDHRFEPISQHELPQLQCSVSLLTDFEPASHWRDFELGVHGVRISFTDRVDGRRRSATFLPEVMSDQGWTHEETMVSLVRKSGFSGKDRQIGARLFETFEVTRYQSRKCHVHYDAYQRWKDGQR